MRKYSVDDINRMRVALDFILLESVPAPLKDRGLIVELQLRTFMLNGTEPEELEEERRGWEITAAGDGDG